MALGSRLRHLRLEAHRTQRSVAAGAHIAAEYLCRLENDRVTPTTRTLLKIADALNVSPSAFFAGDAALEVGDRCPVTASGRCILDHLHAGRGTSRERRAERYCPDQLEVLRTCDYLIHHGSRDVQHTLVTIMRSLFALTEAERRLSAPAS